MNTKTYSKWVGVVLGVLLNGSAHFLSGDRNSGIKWYLGISLAGTVGILVLALPGLAGFIAATAILSFSLILWVCMLMQSYRPIPRIRIRSWIAIIALNCILNTGWQYGIRQIVQPFKVSTAAMNPAIMPGDHVIVERLTYRFKKPERGDIVVFSTSGLRCPAVKPDTFYIKRIAGLPGESVQIDPPNLIINGRIVREPDIFGEISTRSNGFTLAHGDGLTQPKPVLISRADRIVLADNQYLTLGDNTTHSLDGRYYGAISDEQIIGRVSRIYWPLCRIGK